MANADALMIQVFRLDETTGQPVSTLVRLVEVLGESADAAALAAIAAQLSPADEEHADG